MKETDAVNAEEDDAASVHVVDSRRYKRSQNGNIILTHRNETFQPNEYVLDDLYEGLDEADTNSKGEVRCFWIESNGTKSKRNVWIKKRLLTPKLASHVDDGIDDNSIRRVTLSPLLQHAGDTSDDGGEGKLSLIHI